MKKIMAMLMVFTMSFGVLASCAEKPTQNERILEITQAEFIARNEANAKYNGIVVPLVQSGILDRNVMMPGEVKPEYYLDYFMLMYGRDALTPYLTENGVAVTPEISVPLPDSSISAVTPEISAPLPESSSPAILPEISAPIAVQPPVTPEISAPIAVQPPVTPEISTPIAVPPPVTPEISAPIAVPPPVTPEISAPVAPVTPEISLPPITPPVVEIPEIETFPTEPEGIPEIDLFPSVTLPTPEIPSIEVPVITPPIAEVPEVDLQEEPSTESSLEEGGEIEITGGMTQLPGGVESLDFGFPNMRSSRTELPDTFYYIPAEIVETFLSERFVGIETSDLHATGAYQENGAHYFIKFPKAKERYFVYNEVTEEPEDGRTVVKIKASFVQAHATDADKLSLVSDIYIQLDLDHSQSNFMAGSEKYLYRAISVQFFDGDGVLISAEEGESSTDVTMDSADLEEPSAAA